MSGEKIGNTHPLDAGLQEQMLVAKEKLIKAKAESKLARAEEKRMREAFIAESDSPLAVKAREAMANLAAVKAKIRRINSWHRAEDKRIHKEFKRLVSEVVVPADKHPMHLYVLQDITSGQKSVLYLKRNLESPNPPLPDDVWVHIDKVFGDDFSDVNADTEFVYYYHVIPTRTYNEEEE